MGNWRTVNIKGKIDKKEVESIREFLKGRFRKDGIFYLQFSEGIFGLGEWIKGKNINAVGNVYERDCKSENILNELTILAEKYSSLNLVLHLGDNYESLDCVASFIVKDGKCEQVKPMIKKLKDIDF